jgi:hypothetical protein
LPEFDEPFAVEAFAYHPDYSRSGETIQISYESWVYSNAVKSVNASYADIAVLRLAECPDESAFRHPIAANEPPTRANYVHDDWSLLVGFGLTERYEAGGPQAPAPTHIPPPDPTPAEAEEHTRWLGYNAPSTYSADAIIFEAYDEDPKDRDDEGFDRFATLCSGDSGGPVLDYRKDAYDKRLPGAVIGVMSRSNCGNAANEPRYRRAAAVSALYHQNWIENPVLCEEGQGMECGDGRWRYCVDGMLTVECFAPDEIPRN